MQRSGKSSAKEDLLQGLGPVSDNVESVDYPYFVPIGGSDLRPFCKENSQRLKTVHFRNSIWITAEEFRIQI